MSAGPSAQPLADAPAGVSVGNGAPQVPPIAAADAMPEAPPVDATECPESTSDAAARETSARPSPASAAPGDSTSASVAATPAPDDVFLGMTRGDRIATTVLAAAILALIGWHWARLSGWGARDVEIDRHPANAVTLRLDVNTANWVELAQLDGIGEVLSRRIVAYRDEHGPFRSLDDLRRVKGIGAKTLDKLRPWLTVGKDGD